MLFALKLARTMSQSFTGVEHRATVRLRIEALYFRKKKENNGFPTRVKTHVFEKSIRNQSLVRFVLALGVTQTN